MNDILAELRRLMTAWEEAVYEDAQGDDTQDVEGKRKVLLDLLRPLISLQLKPMKPLTDEQYTDMIAREKRRPLVVVEPESINMVLYCPNCGEQHIDAPEPGVPSIGERRRSDGVVEPFHYLAQGEWTNPPHRSHLCHKCGCIWRPADVPTNGVADTKTRGQNDTWVTHSEEIRAQSVQLKPQRKQAAHILLEDDAVELLKSTLSPDDSASLFLRDGHSGYGLYVSLTEHPEEGSILLTSKIIWSE